MVRCKEFYDRWEKEPNWCEKCRAEVYRIDHYLSMIGEFEKEGIKRDTSFDVISAKAMRPLLEGIDPQVKAQAISEIEQSLKHKQEQKEKNRIKLKPITERDVTEIVRKAKMEQLETPITEIKIENDIERDRRKMMGIREIWEDAAMRLTPGMVRSIVNIQVRNEALSYIDKLRDLCNQILTEVGDEIIEGDVIEG